MNDVSRAEYCAVAIADCFADDGELMASPMGLLPSLGARLAKLTSNPLLMITDGEARILQGAPPLGVTQDVVEGWMPFRLVLESVVTYEGTADVHALVVGGALTGIQAFR